MLVSKLADKKKQPIGTPALPIAVIVETNIHTNIVV